MRFYFLVGSDSLDHSPDARYHIVMSKDGNPLDVICVECRDFQSFFLSSEPFELLVSEIPVRWGIIIGYSVYGGF